MSINVQQTINKHHPLARVFYFALVGGLAFTLHILIVLFLVQTHEWMPLSANIAAFCCAFFVSYFGHRYLTFGDQQEKSLKMGYFLTVAISAAAFNEGLYFLLLKLTELNYLISLVIVLICTAVYTFTLSSRWACR